jgi:hypothetical protein
MIDFFLGSEGESLISEVRGDPASETLRLKKKYKTLDPKIINLSIEIATSREKLKHFGDWVGKGLFTARGVSQMSDPEISAFRAERFKGKRVLEIGTGLGIDTYHLSKVAEEVVTIETDPVTREFAKYNLSLLGAKNVKFMTEVSGIFDAVWADPSRRNERGERIKNPEEYSPSLSELRSIKSPIGIKISAAHSGKFDEFNREWIGSGFEVKEQVLWRGFEVRDNTISIPPDSFFIEPNLEPIFLRDIPKDSFYLVEPHPVLLASGLAQSYFAKNDIFSLSKGPSLGISESEPQKSPLYKVYRISEVVRSFQKIKISNRSKVKFFGVPSRKLNFEGEKEASLIITSFNKRNVGFIGCELV